MPNTRKERSRICGGEDRSRDARGMSQASSCKSAWHISRVKSDVGGQSGKDVGWVVNWVGWRETLKEES